MKCLNAIAKFNNTNIKGTVRFHQCLGMEGVYVTIDLYDLTPNKMHAIHIHEFGDETEGCKSLGGHWNPKNTTHGTIFIKNMNRHAGDLINNIYGNKNGNFKYSYYDPLLNLSGNIDTTIIGRSVVIHEGSDDYGLGGMNNFGQVVDMKIHEESLKTGNAGQRMACAIIGRCKDGKISQ